MFVARDLAFHQAVIAASGNKAMIDIYDFFSTSIQETIEATHRRRRAGTRSCRPMQRIVDAIETGDPDKADAAVRRFMAPVIAALDRSLFS